MADLSDIAVSETPSEVISHFDEHFICRTNFETSFPEPPRKNFEERP